MDFIIEPKKKVTVAHDADVAVAGAGTAGVFAAIAAARRGAETVLIDRFGEPGGIMTVGLTVGRLLVEPGHMPKGYAGIPKEFLDRHASLGGKVPQSPGGFHSSHVFENSSAASYVLFQMLRESGVKLILSSYAGDPIMIDDRVAGLYVESKSGRQAVKAKVVIDGTGEADVARRAGASVLTPKPEYYEVDGHAPTGMALFYSAGGIDWERFEKYKESHQTAEKGDVKWAEVNLGDVPKPHLLPLIRKAWESGDYRIVRKIENLELDPPPEGSAEAVHDFGLIKSGGSIGRVDTGIGGGRIRAIRGIDASDGSHISEMEAQIRMYLFETSRFWKKYIPGFENSYLMFASPFLGNRGGACIEGEYVMTVADIEAGKRFPDDLFVFRPSGGNYRPKWTELPYRVLLPKTLEGLIAVGRSASGIPDTVLRNAHMVPHMGQAAGTAAALAAEKGISPKALDVKELQKALLAEGFYLGEDDRLRELGLVDGS